MKYELLNKPFKIGNVELRNRFVMLPMTIEKTDNYHVGDDLVDFYEQRAKGGAALIELGFATFSTPTPSTTPPPAL